VEGARQLMNHQVVNCLRASILAGFHHLMGIVSFGQKIARENLITEKVDQSLPRNAHRQKLTKEAEQPKDSSWSQKI
jgi:hypothetical protein